MCNAFCEICQRKVKAPANYNEKTAPIVCSDVCRQLLIQFTEMFSDENLARLPLPGFGLFMSHEEAEEAKNQTATPPSSQTDP